MLSFNSMPRTILAYRMIDVVFCIGSFVSMSGVSKTLSLMAIVEGTVLDHNLHIRVMLGDLA